MQGLARDNPLVVRDRIADHARGQLDRVLHAGELVPLLGAGARDFDRSLRLRLRQCGSEAIQCSCERRAARPTVIRDRPGERIPWSECRCPASRGRKTSERGVNPGP